MKQIINRIRANFPASTNWKFWISLALVVKTLFFILKSIELNSIDFSFSFSAGDTDSYITPIENLIANGEYYDDYRMPGYGWLYYIFRLIFSQTWALNFLVFTQVFLSAVSVYVLGLISLNIFEKKSFFLLTYFLYLVSTYVSLTDHFLLTESLCTSGLIFSIYFLLKGGRNYFWSGLFLTWVIFLRPVFFPLLFLHGFYIILSSKVNQVKLKTSLLKNMFFLFISFILIDGAWIARNYVKYSKISPLTKTIYYPGISDSYKGAVIRFLNSYGGSIVFWLHSSDVTFFIPLRDGTKKEIYLPNNIYTNVFNSDSLFLVKNMIISIESKSTPTLEKQLLENEVISKLDRYSNSIKNEKPFLYYIGSRIKVFKTFFLHSGTYNLFKNSSYELNMFEYTIKIFYSLLYAFVVLFGFIGLFSFLLLRINNIKFFFISCTGLYSALVFPFLLKMDEYRYFVPGYPIFILGTTYIVLSIYSTVNKKTNE